jgi:hypothetical protein
MFWLFWQLVGIAIALIGIGTAIWVIVGVPAFLVQIFTSPAPHPFLPTHASLGMGICEVRRLRQEV